MALELLGELVDKFDVEDLEKVQQQIEEAIEQAKENETLNEFVDKIKLMGEMIKDYKDGNYQEVPYRSIAVSAFAILYIANPGNKIPKDLPIIGELSDAAVIGLVLYAINEDLESYRQWKSE